MCLTSTDFCFLASPSLCIPLSLSQLIAFKESPLGSPKSTCQEARESQEHGHSSAHPHSLSSSHASHLLVDEDGYQLIRDLKQLNPQANDVLHLYRRPSACAAEGRGAEAPSTGGDGAGQQPSVGGRSARLLRWLAQLRCSAADRLFGGGAEYTPGSVWLEVVLSEQRCARQQRLREAFTALQASSSCLFLMLVPDACP